MLTTIAGNLEHLRVIQSTLPIVKAEWKAVTCMLVY